MWLGWKLRGRCLPAATPAALQRKQAQISGKNFAVCSEAFAAALIWVGVSRIFSHIWWRTVSGSPYPFTQYKAPARCAT